LQWRDNIKCINNGEKIETVHDDDTTPIMNAQWWEARIHDTGLGWL